jgi:hypothetical protein
MLLNRRTFVQQIVQPQYRSIRHDAGENVILRELATEESLAKKREILQSPRLLQDDWFDILIFLERYCG